MTSNPFQKLHNIQALRGIAALLVVLTHLPAMEVKHGGDSILPAIARFGISGVDLFFVISGFVMVYVTWSAKRSIQGSLKFLFARVTRIYPIYWIIAGAVFVGWSVMPGLINFDPEKTSIIKSFLLWPDVTLPMLKVAWTLVHELYFYLIFAVILLLPRRFILLGLCLWAIGVVFGNRLGWSSLSPEAALVFHPLGIEFFLGALAGWVFKTFGGSGGRLILIAGIILAAAALLFLATSFGDDFYPSNWQRVLYFGFPAVLLVYGLAGSEAGGWQLPLWMSRFGDWSYSLYLSHILTLSVLGYLWRPFAVDGPVDNVIALIVMTAGCIFASAVSWYLFERPLLSVFRKVRGRLFPTG